MYLKKKSPAEGVLSGFIYKVILRDFYSESHPCFNNGSEFYSESQPLSIKRVGFTLIELLVVVLIIGILAAVAVPQYQKAVAKARLAGFVQQAYAIRNALRMYKLANGQNASKLSDLDIWASVEQTPVSGKTETAYIGEQEYYDIGGRYIRTQVALPGYQSFQCDFQWEGLRAFCYTYSGEELAKSMGWEKFNDNEGIPYWIGQKSDWQ